MLVMREYLKNIGAALTLLAVPAGCSEKTVRVQQEQKEIPKMENKLKVVKAAPAMTPEKIREINEKFLTIRLITESLSKRSRRSKGEVVSGYRSVVPYDTYDNGLISGIHFHLNGFLQTLEEIRGAVPDEDLDEARKLIEDMRKEVPRMPADDQLDRLLMDAKKIEELNERIKKNMKEIEETLRTRKVIDF